LPPAGYAVAGLRKDRIEGRGRILPEQQSLPIRSIEP
jgi:hypothetical protein